MCSLTTQIALVATTWIISLGLFALGLWLLILGIKQIQKAVGAPVLLKLPLTQISGQFVLTHAGEYAIWQSGRTIQRVPVKMPTPVISALQTGKPVRVQSSFSGMWVNDGWEGRIQLFTFRAQAGTYQLGWPTNAAMPHTQTPIFLEIRERRSGSVLVWGILLVLIAAACLISGLVFSIV
ncbi:hypothetical protein [Spirosoma humi]